MSAGCACMDVVKSRPIASNHETTTRFVKLPGMRFLSTITVKHAKWLGNTWLYSRRLDALMGLTLQIDVRSKEKWLEPAVPSS